ncbi:hypothetical protein RBB50_012627 [Rhinocladiella similis]
MESSHSSHLEDSRNAILKDGFFTSQDPLLGANIEKMDEDAVPFASARGLNFCKDNVLDYPRIRPILESFFERSILGLYRSIGATVGDYTFSSDPNSEAEILLVQLWSKESTVTYWAGSHSYWLSPVRAENSLLRVPRARLDQLGLRPTTVGFKHGGFAILDGRTAFEASKGTAITFAFGIEAKARTWRPMRLPKSQDIERVVTQMENKSFGLNVAFIEEEEEEGEGET